MNINLELYKIFYFVAKYKGITLAAKHLCISQPAVSQAIKQLEQALGISLFVRTPKGVTLTNEGSTLYSYISKGYEQIKLGESQLLKMLNLESGEIHIGASDMTLKFYLLPFLETFHEMYPAVKVIVTNAPTPETLDYLANGKIDFGIVSSPIANSPDITLCNVREIEDIFIAGSNFSSLSGIIMNYTDLETLPIICLEKNTSTRHYVDSVLENYNVKLCPEFELATSDMIVQFALRNLGIGCVVKDFADNYINSSDSLFELNFNEKIPQRHICTVVSNKHPVSTAAKKLLDIMKK